MIRRPPRSTPYPTLFPYTTLFRSCKAPIKEITNGLCTVSRDYSISNSCSYRSEEHTSELQPHSEISYAVFCLKKKKEHALIGLVVVWRDHERGRGPQAHRGFFFLMIRRPPRSTPYPTLFPCATLFRSPERQAQQVTSTDASVGPSKLCSSASGDRKSTRLNSSHIQKSRMPYP